MRMGKGITDVSDKIRRSPAWSFPRWKPRDPENVERRARKAHQKGRLQEAIALCQSAISSGVESPSLLLTLGELYQKAGQDEQAVARLVEAIELSPGTSRGYQKLLEILGEQNAREKTVRILERIYQAYRQYPQPQNYYATALLFTGEFQEAGKLFEDLCLRYPDYDACHNNLGILRFYQGRFAEAEREYRTALAMAGKHPERSTLSSVVYGNLAEMRAWRGDFPGAIEYCNAGVAFGHTSFLYVNLGDYYAAMGMAEEAIKAYEKSFALEGGPAIDGLWDEAHRRLARLYLKTNRLEQATAACRALLEKNPANAGIHKVLGDIYFQKGSYPQAVDEYRSALSLEPSSAENLKMHRSLALAYFKAGMFDKATAEFRRASLFHPEQFFINIEKPGVEGASSSPDKEVARYREALVHWPEDSRLRARLADAYIRQGRLEAALSEYQRALEQDPMDTESRIKTGMIYIAEDEVWKAIHCFARVLEISPGSAPAYTGLGCVHLERGAINQAILWLKMAIYADSQYPDAHNYLGNAFRILGRLGEAMDEYRTAIEFYPGYAQAHNNMGIALLAKGEVHEAIDSFNQAVRLFPQSVSALCHIGEGYFRLGQFQEAREALEQALCINPYNARAQSLLEQIYMSPGRVQVAGGPGRATPAT
ncbi:MAG: tetratricopeptide repeat protein [Firmicutes bacterium]|nr:tetratricopeptide repeat protein [Bacillota bacterium]